MKVLYIYYKIGNYFILYIYLYICVCVFIYIYFYIIYIYICVYDKTLMTLVDREISNVFLENQGRTRRTRSKIESSVPKIAKEKGRPG